MATPAAGDAAGDSDPLIGYRALVTWREAAADALRWVRLTNGIRPRRAFGKLPTPSPPEYSDEDSWAVLPDRPAKSEMLPDGVAPGPPVADRRADVFFLHPTTYFGRRTWNQPLDHRPSRELVDELIVAGQTSVFNGSCRIFAPRFRQATFYSFLGNRRSGRQALELAYDDCRRAFEHYLSHWNEGRPFFLAGHSQGTLHGIRLLEERIDGDPCLDRMVAAYLPGFSLPLDKLGAGLRRVVASEGPAQTRCVVAWDTYLEGGGPVHRLDQAEHWYSATAGEPGWQRRRNKRVLGVNPLSWTRDRGVVGREHHRGGVKPNLPPITSLIEAVDGDVAPGLVCDRLVSTVPCQVSARLGEDGYLYVSEPLDPALRLMVLPGGSLHNYDWSLFWHEARANVAERLAAFG